MRASQHLVAIQNWIIDNASLDTAIRIVDDILARCGSLAEFPNRGTPRDDLFPGLRTVPHRRRFTICYLVYIDIVVVVGIVGAGQDLNVMFDDTRGS